MNGFGLHSGHGIFICQFGTTHRRCRCPNENHVWIQCDTPEKCNPSGAEYAPRHRKDIRSGKREIRIET
jgi:hypothetical protein